MRNHRDTGFTLLEIILVCSLLILLLTLCLQVLMPLIGTYIRTDRRTALIQGVAAAMDKVEVEVLESNMRGIHFLTTPVPGVASALTIQPLGPPTISGAVSWSAELHSFVWRGAQLEFHPWRGSNLLNHATDTPYALQPAELTQILEHKDSTLLLAVGVDQFQVVGLEANQRLLPLKIDLSVTLPTGEKCALSREMMPRNRHSR